MAVNRLTYGGKSARRIIEDGSVEVLVDKGYGVVTCIVTLEGKTDRYHNLKVFTLQMPPAPPASWQCVYWRVTTL